MSSGRRAPGRPRLVDLAEPTETAILRAAAQLFMEHGYRGVTMEMVADAAGLTKAAVYYHFHDKASLVVSTMERTFEAARSATQDILDRPLPLRDRLEILARVVLGLPHPYIAFDALMHEALSELNAGQLRTVREAEASVTAPLEQALFDASAQGEIRAGDPLLLCHSFVAALRVGQAASPDGRALFPDFDRAAKELVAIFWRGVAGDQDR